MRLAAVLVLSLLAAPAFAQEAPDLRQPLPEGSYRVVPKGRAAPPAVTLEAKPETFDASPDTPQLTICKKLDPTDKTLSKLCRLEPQRKERHPDYGKGKLYPLTPI